MISSTSNSQVKFVVGLQTKAKLRKEYRQFVVEGTKMVLEAPREAVDKVYYSESYEMNNKDIIGNTINNLPHEVVTDNVFKQMSDTKTPQGILAVINMKRYSIDDIIEKNVNINGKTKKFLVLIENLQDPGNLGTIIRTSEGAGVTGIIMSSNTVDVYNPKTIRSTMGSIYRVPFVYEDDFIEALSYISKKSINIYAAHLNGNNSYTDEKYSDNVAFLIGNEGNGLSEEATEKAQILIKIPMSGKVESLNASIATAILLYEAKRQFEGK